MTLHTMAQAAYVLLHQRFAARAGDGLGVGMNMGMGGGMGGGMGMGRYGMGMGMGVSPVEPGMWRNLLRAAGAFRGR